jgi:acid phosphatase family membrane protein YuiD
VKELLTSPYLWAAGLGFLLAELSKIAVAAGRHKAIKRLKLFHQSGGMPSSHVAAVAALATTVGLFNGLNSAIFAVALVFAFVVMTDAVRVRRATGEQGDAIESLIKKTGAKVKLPYNAHGHTLVEILAGGVLGIVIGIIVYFTTK